MLGLELVKSPKVVLLIGPPLSGKDTLLRSMDTSGYKIISRDDILMSVCDEGLSYSEAFRSVDHSSVDRILNQEISDAILNEEDVIINMINLSVSSRLRKLSRFGKKYQRVAVVFPILNLCDYVARNEERAKSENKKMDINLITSLAQKFEPIDNEKEKYDLVITI